jgi:hypothetical protein
VRSLARSFRDAAAENTSAGNVLTPDEQQVKLALVVDTAQQVWG